MNQAYQVYGYMEALFADGKVGITLRSEKLCQRIWLVLFEVNYAMDPSSPDHSR